MNHFFEGISGWFNFADIYSEAVERAENGAHFVEVGAWLGKSSAFMAVEIINSGKDIRFDIVDTWLGVPGGEATYNVPNALEVFTANMQPVRGYYSAYQGLSVVIAEMYNDESLDFVFIDADHSYEAVLSDLRAWFFKVKEGGIIAGHDYDHDTVKQAVDEFFDNYFVEVCGTSWIVYV